MQTNDAMKEYLTASPQQFMELCKKAAKTGYNLACQKIEGTNYGCIMLATEDKADSWMNVRKQIFLVQFYRESNAVDEGVVRRVMDTVKDKGYYKAVIFSSSGFTVEAINYAENRQVVLAGKEIVENILARAGV